MASTAIKFGYSSKELDALELAISAERFKPYIDRAGGSRAKAILVYERNTAISESLYGVTQAAEIVLRNSIHRCLTAAYGAMWFDNITLEESQAAKLLTAKANILKDRRILTPGAVVAELSLGFWTALISRTYHASLWTPHLHKAFPYATVEKKNSQGETTTSRLGRSDIFDPLERLRVLRNRIAHHEPVLKLDLQKLHSEALTIIKWICPTSSDWVRHTTNFPQRFHEKPLNYAPPKMPPEPAKPIPGKPS